MLPEELRDIISLAESSMKEAIQFCKKEFSYIRAGKASPSLLENIRVDYYGSSTPLNQLANISAPEARLLTVEPYDKSVIKDIEKRSEEHTSELQSRGHLVCRLLLEKKKKESQDQTELIKERVSSQAKEGGEVDLMEASCRSDNCEQMISRKIGILESTTAHSELIII